MNKKTVIVPFLAAAAIMLMSCSDSSSTSLQENEEQTDQEESLVDVSSNESASTSLSFDTSAQISETILYDAEGIVITATSLSYDDDFESGMTGVNLNISVRNDSGQEIIISCEAGTGNAVNGYSMGRSYGGWLGYNDEEITIASGDSVDTYVLYPYVNLFRKGITVVADIEVNFSITAGEEQFYTGPLQIDTSAADSYDYDVSTFQTAIQDEAVLARCEYLSLLYFSTEDVFDNYGIQTETVAIVEEENCITVLLELLNTSDTTVDVTIQKPLIVNGLVMETVSPMHCDIAPGNRAIEEFWIYSTLSDYWSAAGLDSLNEIDFTLYVEKPDYANDGISYGLGAAGSVISVSDDTGGNEVDTSHGVLYEDDDVRLIVEEPVLSEENDYGNLVFLLENNSNEERTITVQLTEINGIPVDNFSDEVTVGADFSIALGSGQRSFVTFSCYGLFEYLRELSENDESMQTDIVSCGITMDIQAQYGTDDFYTVEASHDYYDDDNG